MPKKQAECLIFVRIRGQGKAFCIERGDIIPSNFHIGDILYLSEGCYKILQISHHIKKDYKYSIELECEEYEGFELDQNDRFTDDLK